MAAIPQYQQGQTTGYTAPSYNFGPYTPAATTPASTPASSATNTPAAGAVSNYMDMGGGWNPYQYATDAATNNLTNLLGGTATKTAATNGGPFSVPQQNEIDFGNGYVANAGLTQQFIDAFGLDQAKKMFADQAAVASGSKMGMGTDPSLVGYNPVQVNPNPAAPAKFGPGSGFYSAQNPPNSAPAANPFMPTQGQQNFAPINQPVAQNLNPYGGFDLNSFMTLASLFGGGQQSNPFSGVAQLLNMISGLQSAMQPQYNPYQMMGYSPLGMNATPNNGLYFPSMG